MSGRIGHRETQLPVRAVGADKEDVECVLDAASEAVEAEIARQEGKRK